MMASSPVDSPLPAYGSLVGPWIVGKNIGSGSYGTVFRAVHKDRPEAGDYALKVARRAGDARFEREAWLLSRVRHASVPRFEDSGTWTSPRGEDYPYVVMEWVEGISLYAWALEHGLTLRRAISQLAQVTRALQAIHSRGVHRDVKGGNIRVSDEGRAVLLDFGSCWYSRASPLTDGHVLPGTGRYRSPQLLLFREAVVAYKWQGYYQAQPADDLYSLGVTAYRLLAGDYPPSELGAADGSQKVVRMKAPRELEEGCPELGGLIERLLSDDPQERGSAQAVAEELEALLEYSRPELDKPWKADTSRQSTVQVAPPAPRKPTPPPAPREQAVQEPAPRQAPAAPVEPAGKLGHAGVLALLGVLWMVGVLTTRDGDRGEVASTEPARPRRATGSPDAGPAGLGEEALASVNSAETPLASVSEKQISREVPAEPFSDQKLPPCPERSAVVINGGCWRPQVPAANASPCDSDLYEHQGRCYAPILISAKRVPTSKDPQ
jgi:hypothetical protein